MGKAKDIFIKPIKARVANDVIKKIHYSGKVVPNSQIHFGVFLDGKLEGAMQFGPSINKKGALDIPWTIWRVSKAIASTRRMNNKGVLDRPWTIWRVLRAEI